MINLLPYEHKLDIRAARTNIILLRYIIIVLAASIVLGGLIAGSYVVLNGAQESAKEKVSANEQRAVEYKQVSLDADSFRSDLATAKTVLDSDVSFSRLIYRIANTIPANVTLDGLSLDPQTFGTPTTLDANAKTFRDATTLKDSLTANTDLFSNVQLQTVRTGDSGSDEYPVKVVFSLVINKEALK